MIPAGSQPGRRTPERGDEHLNYFQLTNMQLLQSERVAAWQGIQLWGKVSKERFPSYSTLVRA